MFDHCGHTIFSRFGKKCFGHKTAFFLGLYPSSTISVQMKPKCQYRIFDSLPRACLRLLNGSYPCMLRAHLAHAVDPFQDPLLMPRYKPHVVKQFTHIVSW